MYASELESSLGNFKDVKCEVKGVYYSDHDCVQISLSDNVGLDNML